MTWRLDGQGVGGPGPKFERSLIDHAWQSSGGKGGASGIPPTRAPACNPLVEADPRETRLKGVEGMG